MDGVSLPLSVPSQSVLDRSTLSCRRPTSLAPERTAYSVQDDGGLRACDLLRAACHAKDNFRAKEGAWRSWPPVRSLAGRIADPLRDWTGRGPNLSEPPSENSCRRNRSYSSCEFPTPRWSSNLAGRSRAGPYPARLHPGFDRVFVRKLPPKWPEPTRRTDSDCAEALGSCRLPSGGLEVFKALRS
jgi:hypothetical protein